VSRRIRYQPVNAIIGLIIVSIIFGLLCLINSVAANALFSLFVASNYVAWGVPIMCRLVWGKDRFQPGEFYMGFLSKPIAIVAVVWLLFGLVLSMFPSDGPNPTRKFSSSLCMMDIVLTIIADSMNYTIVLNGFVWLASATYYILFARKWYTGPKMTVETHGDSPGSASREDNDTKA